MKKLISALALLLVTPCSYCQGELFFSTRNPAAGVDAPVWHGTQGPGPTYSAGLFLNGVLEPSSLTTFRAPGTGGAAILDRYVDPVTANFPGHPAGTSITLAFAAWRTAAGSLAAAKGGAGDWGESASFTVTLGGAPNPPADLPTTLQGFIFPFPEPSTFVLGAVGGAAMLLLRRRK